MKRIILFAVGLSLIATLVYAGTVSVSVNTSYQQSGVSVTVARSINATVNNTNVNLVPFNCGTIDTSISITPITSNAYITLINNDATNAQNIIQFGNSTSNYTGYIRPQEVAVFRLLPGGDGKLHVAATNGQAAGLVLIPPNP